MSGTYRAICIMSLCVASYALTDAQRRILVSPSNEIIRLFSANALKQGSRFRDLPNKSSTFCGSKFVFGYPPSYYPANSNFASYPNDLMGMWFVAPAPGTIDTLLWELDDAPGVQSDTMAEVRIYRSNIYHGSGPGYGPYAPPPC